MVKNFKFHIKNIKINLISKMSYLKQVKFIFILIFFISLIFFNGCKKSSINNIEKLRIAEATRSVFYSPQYVADSLGFFKKRGIEVEFITNDGSDKTMTSVLSQSVEIGLAGAEMALYVKREGKGNHPIIFAQLTQKDGSFIVGRKSNIGDKNFDIDNLKDFLIGKSIIAGRPGGLPFMSLEYVLKNLGIYNNVNLLTNIKFEIMGPSFTSGTGDFVMLFEPAATKLVNSGDAVEVASLGELIGNTCYTCYFSNPGFIKNNRELIQNFVYAIHEGQVWVKTHKPIEIVQKIKDYFPGSDEEILVNSVENYKRLNVWSESPLISKDEFDKVLEISGCFEDMKFNSFVDNTFSEKSLEKMKNEGLDHE